VTELSYATIEVISTAECARLLREQILGRLAVIADGRPLLFPVNYAFHAGQVVFRTDPGTKLSAAVDRAVAFEIDGIDAPYHEGWSVVVHGTAHEEKDPLRVRELDQLELRPWAPGGKDRWLYIGDATMSGRRLTYRAHD
jgi:uncharacterized protein